MILRLRSTKLGKVRFVGHRDVARIWDRVLRRCRVPVAFTAGFTPRPRIALGLALPMGAESLAEYIDVELTDGAERPEGAADPAPLANIDDLDRLTAELSAILPDGIDVTAAGLLERPVTSLQEAVTSCTWELWAPGITSHHVEQAAAILDRSEVLIERTRKGQRSTDDVRPQLLDLRPSHDGERLVADLATTGRAVRPSELATVTFPHLDPLDVRVRRTHQWTTHGDDRREVLSLPAAVGAPDRGVGA